MFIPHFRFQKNLKTEKLQFFFLQKIKISKKPKSSWVVKRDTLKKKKKKNFVSKMVETLPVLGKAWSL